MVTNTNDREVNEISKDAKKKKIIRMINEPGVSGACL
jgi:hypothetical protein